MFGKPSRLFLKSPLVGRGIPMAVERMAAVIGVQDFPSGARVLSCQSPDFGFRGGQFLYLATGCIDDDGKEIKRIYSFLSSDDVSGCFDIAVQQVAGGPGSTFVHGLQPGDEIRFTGPWGLYHPDDAGMQRTLIVATDTAITSALGLLNSESMRSSLPSSGLLWLAGREQPFLPVQEVRQRLPATLAAFQYRTIPNIGDSSRTSTVVPLLQNVLNCFSPARLFVAGDGRLVSACRTAAEEFGLSTAQIRVEHFFHQPPPSEKV